MSSDRRRLVSHASRELPLFAGRVSHQDSLTGTQQLHYMTQASASGFLRRLMSMLYESLMLIAVLFIASFIFHLIFRDTSSILFRPAFQLYLLLIAGIYFIWFWTHGGQTLPMQTWKLRVISSDGQRLYLKQALPAICSQ